MDNTQEPLTQADLDAHPELVAAGLKVGDMPIPADQLQDYTVTEFDTELLATGVLKIGDVIKVPKPKEVIAPEPKMEEYRAVLDAVHLSGKTLLQGETAEADSNDPVVQGLVAAGAIRLVGSAPIEPVVETSVAEQEVAADTEPRKRYRGRVVLEDGERTVEGRTYHHIKLDDGSEMDLNDLEYDTEVKVSYPPVK